MRTVLLIIALLLPLAGVSQGQVYRHVDAQGKVTFSDKPQKGAEKVTVDPVQTFSAPTSTPQNVATQTTPDKPASYSDFTIVKPTDGETIWNNPGNFTVTLNIVPKLQPGDQVQVLIDGAAFGQPSRQKSVNIKGVDRGEHTVSAQIIDASGNVVTQTSSVTIHLHQASVNMPSRR